MKFFFRSIEDKGIMAVNNFALKRLIDEGWNCINEVLMMESCTCWCLSSDYDSECAIG